MAIIHSGSVPLHKLIQDTTKPNSIDPSVTVAGDAFQQDQLIFMDDDEDALTYAWNKCTQRFLSKLEKLDDANTTQLIREKIAAFHNQLLDPTVYGEPDFSQFQLECEQIFVDNLPRFKVPSADEAFKVFCDIFSITFYFFLCLIWLTAVLGLFSEIAAITTGLTLFSNIAAVLSSTFTPAVAVSAGIAATLAALGTFKKTCIPHVQATKALRELDDDMALYASVYANLN